MLRSVVSLSTVRGTQPGPPHLRDVQLSPPPHLTAALGCDAVGVPSRYGARLLGRLPGNGCVFADPDWWWWLVPAGSDADLRWPLPACYAPGAYVPDRRPRLIHRPGCTSPYTPPIPLYLMVCQLTGTAPSWTLPGVGSRH
ncbi:hypothetical protein BJP40_13135 [Streptomyces sp. CC53]|uniref:hypothetical protein n=1 Tax=unclassified Streptomyces TaxID=2593676 RepID=UPI0008DDDB0B|nr:hypothetical protein BJP40_13135 [Streptomyces sp. CC53]